MAQDTKDRGAEIEVAVNEAIAKGDFDLAFRLSSGHPDPAKHGELHIAITNAKAKATVGDQGGDAPPPAGDLLGEPQSRMFEIRRENADKDGRSAKIGKFVLLTEKHGNNDVLGVSIPMTFNMPQHFLDAFDEDLRLWMFAPGADGTGDLADRSHPAPNLRHDDIAPEFRWKRNYIGYRLVIPHGINPKKPLVLSDCRVKGIVFRPQKGGQVLVDMRVVLNPSPEQMGQLSRVMNTQHDVELIAPEGAEEVDGDDE